MIYMLRNPQLLLILLLLPLMSFGAVKDVLKGRITDTTGQPIVGAIIEITDLNTGVVSDVNGYYRIEDVHKGSYLVAVRILGYATQTRNVSINGETIENFSLKESVIEKNAVIVTGTSIAGEERKSITPIQSISIRDIEKNASSNIIDAITQLPGVSQLGTGPAVSKPVIRGLGYNRVVTMNDGIRQEGQQWGDEHGIEVDDYNVSRVEVLKGPASIIYGSDALAGVVNIISSLAAPEGKIIGNITTNCQTNNGLFVGHADISGRKKGFYWSGYITGKAAHDYHNAYDGYVYDSRYNNANFGATIGMSRSKWSSSLVFTSFNQHLGIPEGIRDSATGRFLKDYNNNGTATQALTTNSDGHDYKMAVPYQQIFHQKLIWSNDFYLNNNGRIGVTIAYQNNKRREYPDVLDDKTPGLALLLQTTTYDAKYYLPEWKQWRVTAGINGMFQDNKNQGIEFLVPNYSLFDIGEYVVAKKEWEKWAFSGGARYDFRYLFSYPLNSDVYVAGNPKIPNVEWVAPFIRNFSNASGSIGSSYSFNGHTILKLNLASGYRNPNIAELAAKGVHDGTVRYEYGNIYLKAEHSAQMDLGLSWNTDHIMVNASVFDNYIRNFIFVRKLQGAKGADSIPVINNSNNFPAFVYDQSDANLYGGELNIDFHPHPFDWLHLEYTLSYVRGNFVFGSGNAYNLPFMPPARQLLQVRVQKRTYGKWFRNLYAKIGLDMNFAQNNVYTAYNTETATPGYNLLDAGLGFDYIDKKQKTVFTFSFSAQNITDVAYQSALSRLKYTDENFVTGRTGIYNMGRTFSFTLSVPFDVK